MYTTIKRIYANTKNVSVVEKAVEKGWITQAEAESILGTITAPVGSPE